MKRYRVVLFSAVFACVIGFGWGMTNAAGGRGAGGENLSSPAPKANSHEVFKAIRDKRKQIALDLKAGKISQAQAQTLREKVRSIHQKHTAYLRGNGNADLSESQKTELKNSLDQLK